MTFFEKLFLMGIKFTQKNFFLPLGYRGQFNRQDHTIRIRTHDLTKSRWVSDSVTRLGDLLDFGQVFKINLPKSPSFLGIFVKVSKYIIFLVKSFLGNFYGHLAIIFWSHWSVSFNCASYFNFSSIGILCFIFPVSFSLFLS